MTKSKKRRNGKTFTVYKTMQTLTKFLQKKHSKRAMASSSYSLLPLLAFLLAFQPILFVKSDESFIIHMCKKTPESVICSDCLNSDPASKIADAKGLALTAAKCAKNETTSMFESISKLSKKTPAGSPVKTILGDCAFNTSVALRLYDGVSFNIDKKDYAAAREILSEFVMPFSNACFNKFSRLPKGEMPPDVQSGTEAANKALKVTMGILSNI